MLNDEEENKKEKEPIIQIDHTVEERKLVIYNIPCLTIMLMNNLERDTDTEDIYMNRVLEMYNRATQDSEEEVRIASSRIFSHVRFSFLIRFICRWWMY